MRHQSKPISQGFADALSDWSHFRTEKTVPTFSGNASRGERLYGSAPFGKRQTQTLIAGLSANDIAAPWLIKGAMNREAFDTYIEHVLIPEIEPGTVVILDNLSTHKSPRAAEILRQHGCWFLFLPPYSLDLDPVEMAFSKLTTQLRRIGARTIEQFFSAIGDICNLYK